MNKSSNTAPSPASSPSPPAANSNAAPPPTPTNSSSSSSSSSSNSSSTASAPPPPSPSPPSPSPPPPSQPPPAAAAPPPESPPLPKTPTPVATTPPADAQTPPPQAQSPPTTEPSNQAPPQPVTASAPPPPVTAITPPVNTVAVPPPLDVPISSGEITSPPPPPHKSPPPHSTSQSSSDSNSSSSQSSSTIPFIAAGAGVGTILLVMFIVCAVCISRRKKRKRVAMEYYRDHSLGPKGGEYYSGSHPVNWHNHQHMNLVMKVPPPPGVMVPPRGGWDGSGAVLLSGEMTTNFSGPQQAPLPPPSPSLGLGFNKSTFSYDELAAATGGFAQANLLGQGGFGYVHKGVLISGKEIAVKSLKAGSGQGEREFQAEVEIISRVHHRHLVSLVGYCIAEGRRLLVYEFVPNKTLEHHLHGKNSPTMDWDSRLRIALGSAKGLAYLHEDCHPRIIHRDIKAANILLDNNFEAMVADFGLAKLSSDNYTHVSTRVMGTFGYLAPEYASSGKLTEKSDVFSFGVMLLELITGRKPVDTTNTYMEDSLVDWARPLMSRAMEEGVYDELVDPGLQNSYNQAEMASMVACAAAAVRHSAKRRPKMSQMVRALEGEASLEDLNDGPKPGQSSAYGANSNGSSDYDTNCYNADMMKFRKVVMTSQEFGSSEHGATSEYGLHPSSSSGDSREMPQGWNRKHNAG